MNPNVLAAIARERAEAAALDGFRRCRDWSLLFARNCVACLLAASWLAGRFVWTAAVALACAAVMLTLAADCARFAVIWARIHRTATGRWPWAGDKGGART